MFNGDILECNNCILENNKKRIRVRDETLKRKSKYIPSSISVLFIAESPPIRFSENPEKYFYASGKISRNGLFFHLMSVLVENFIVLAKDKDKEYFLDKFEKSGYYLIDMVKCPINDLSRSEKKSAIKSCAINLEKEIGSLKIQNPDKKIIFIGKTTFNRIENHLNLDFKPIVIPFPRYQNIERFRKGLIGIKKISLL